MCTSQAFCCVWHGSPTLGMLTGPGVASHVVHLSTSTLSNCKFPASFTSTFICSSIAEAKDNSCDPLAQTSATLKGPHGKPVPAMQRGNRLQYQTHQPFPAPCTS